MARLGGCVPFCLGHARFAVGLVVRLWSCAGLSFSSAWEVLVWICFGADPPRE